MYSEVQTIYQVKTYLSSKSIQRKILNSKCPTLYDLKPTANKISYATNWPRGQNI